ncbi:MAG: alpha/beta fold hydrolase [Halioglobus sp.]|nr:alpha/beta fold hydrolase [Halioglobus sp.]MCB1707448.1 alpha/beta fold hydrolase [Halioglobus sp.]MCP5123587.1 alpha/beta fold hydrolase [Pseudomonadales bacterium]MCP5193576.1 alpha/beta fold hydrolase [Pseudomonadales bacterium]
MDFPTRQIQINGIRMNVVIVGEGPDVLLVHGYPDTHAIWRHQIPVLVAAGYRVIAPDTRGCGETEISPGRADYNIHNLVADLIGLLDALGIDRVRLVAHDWGAGISWQLAIDHPERVDRYVALSTGHPMAYRSGGLAQKLKGYYTMMFQLPWLPEWLLSGFNWFGLRLLTGFPEEHSQWISQQSRPGRLRAGLNYYRANAGLFISGYSANARVRVLGVWSSGDRFLAEGQMRDSARFVDGTFRYARIEGANHWLQLSGADKFNPLLLDYLK